MKALLLSMALIISTPIINAQDEPLPLSPNSTWQMFWYSMIDFSDHGTFAYHFLEEVNFNDTLYYPVEQYSYCGEKLTPLIVAYMREDSGKWYQRLSENETEQLLFDFTLEVGNSVSLNECYGTVEGYETLWVTGIEDIVMYDGTTRRKWTLEYDISSFYYGNVEYWIEGIGNMYIGIISGLSHTCIDLNTNLHCFFEQEERIFPDNEFPFGIDCCSPVGIEESTFNETILLFPNPANSKLNLQSSMTISAIEISDLFGRIMFRLQANAKFSVLNVEWLAKGCYVLSVTMDNGTVETLIFLKE